MSPLFAFCLPPGLMQTQGTSKSPAFLLRYRFAFSITPTSVFLIQADSPSFDICRDGKTALMEACQRGMEPIVGLLLDAGAKPNQQSMCNSPP